MLITVLLVASLLVSSLPALAQTGTVLENADYVFPDVSGQGGAPDPAVWTTQQIGTVPVQGAPGLGWGIADPDSASQLLYGHVLSFLSGSPTSPNAKNTANFSVTLRTSGGMPDTTPPWDPDDNVTGGRVILDDGSHRVELALARDPVSKARPVRLLGAPSSAPVIPFPWDNDFPNTYEIARDTNGDFVVTLTNGDSTVPNRVTSQRYSKDLTAMTSGVPRVAWGMGLKGGGATFWQEAHAQVNSVEVSFASFLLTDLQVRARANNDKIQVKAIFIPASGQTTDPATQAVSLTLRRSADSSPFWPTLFGNPITGFTLNGVDTYALSPAEKTRTGLQAFDIKKGVWSFFTAVDTRTALSPLDYSQVLVEFRVGGQVGVQLVRMIENPLGSGNWRFSSGP